MGFYIGIEDLAANALIECLLKTENARFVTYKQLEEYGSEVIRFLNNKGENAILILSRERTNDMFRNYSDFFEEESTEKGLGIKLKEGKSCNDLIEKFRGYLAWDVLLAFVNEQTVAKLDCADV